MNTDINEFSTKPISCDIHDFVKLTRGIAERWVIKDMLPFGGKMLIWGDTNTGKSPLAATLALSVLRGEPFLRKMPCCKGNVAYMMMPDMGLKEWGIRWEKLDDHGLLPDPGTMYANYHHVNARIDKIAAAVAKKEEKDEPLEGPLEWVADLRAYKPALVIIDVLGESHDLDLNDGLTPGKIYDSWRTVCGSRPGMVFIHHDKKQGHDVTGKVIQDPQNSFSGRKEWINLCSSGLRLEQNNGVLHLRYTKTRNNALKGSFFPIHLNEETLLMDIGDNKWGRVWSMLEKGTAPDVVAKTISSKQFSLNSAERMVAQVVAVLDSQAELRREESMSAL